MVRSKKCFVNHLLPPEPVLRLKPIGQSHEKRSDLSRKVENFLKGITAYHRARIDICVDCGYLLERCRCEENRTDAED